MLSLNFIFIELVCISNLSKEKNLLKIDCKFNQSHKFFISYTQNKILLNLFEKLI
jgi:hypothetical protein